MSIKDCIDSAVAQGEFTLEEGQALKKRFDALFRQLNSRGEARERLIGELEAEAAERKRRALLTERRRQALTAALLAHRNLSGQQDPAKALEMLLEHFGGAKFQDVENLRLVILGETHAKLESLLHEFRKGAVTGDKKRLFGQSKAKLDNVVRELFGEKTGDKSAAELGDAWSQVSEELRQRFNAAGGAVGKLEKWGLPQHHDPLALLNQGQQRWRDRIMQLLDRDRMVSSLTGQRLTDDELREALDDIWLTITTDGWHKREPSGAGVGKGALYKQHADHRFLHFKDADSWLAYQREFGEADPFNAMMGHVAGMARDIAAMEVLGPNPEAMLTYLKQVVQSHAAKARPLDAIVEDLQHEFRRMSGEGSPHGEKFIEITQKLTQARDRLAGAKRWMRRGSTKGAAKVKALEDEIVALSEDLNDVSLDWRGRGDELREELQDAIEARRLVTPPPGRAPEDRARRSIARVDAMWEIMRGSANAPVNTRVANVLATTRNLVAASSLGTAAVTALGDLGLQTGTRLLVGLSSKRVMHPLAETIAMFRTGTRREAVRAGLIADSAVHTMHAQARYVGSINSKAVSSYLVDRVLALSGLSPWTQAGKHAFGMAVQAEFADRVGLSFADLPDALRNTLDRHGIGANDWDVIRQAPLYEPKPGAVFLRPGDILSKRVREKYHAMLLRQTRLAVPEGTVRSTSVLTAGRPGTLIGEVSRNFAQFKSFGVAVVMLHGHAIASELGAGRRARGMGYAGTILLTTTVYGAFAMMLKDIAKGQDPRSMDTPEFWGAAMLQGGGLGIYGDFLFSGVNRFGGGLVSTIAGPVPGRVDRLRDSTIGNVFKAADDPEKSNIGRDAVGLLRDWTPGGNIWYLRALYERNVLDQLQYLADPEAHKAMRRKMKNQQSRFGNRYYWEPGKRLPGRAPALGG